MRKYGLFQTGKQKIIVKTKAELKKMMPPKRQNQKLGMEEKKRPLLTPFPARDFS